MLSISDDELLGRTKQGDKTAFEHLVLRYRAPAVRFAATLVGPDYAEDMAQEAFAKAYFRSGDYKGGTCFKSWLYAILRNTCIDYLRRRHNLQSLDESALGALPNEPQQFLDKAEQWQQFQLSFNKLGADARSALYLYAYEDMSYQAIGVAMCKSTTQIKMIIYRARKRLKKEASSYDR